MRDPIPWDRPRLLVLLKSQFMLLADAVKDPVKYVNELNRHGPYKVDDLSTWPIPKLRAQALENAEKILELILNGQLTGGF